MSGRAETAPQDADVLDLASAEQGFSRASIAMVITNPRLDDNPIVFVNDAFERVTGYARSAAIGRNCRFLQGEQTDERTVSKLHKAVDETDEAAVDILNYRADGTPFRNRLIISPIFGKDGTCEFFVGIQKELRNTDGDTQRADAQLRNIQSRVNNHLAQVIGMIRDLMRGRTAVEDFQTLSRRIESLQLLYEEIDVSHRGSRDCVDLATYLTRLASAIAHERGRRGIRVTVDLEPVVMNVDGATRMGLILSEVLDNAFTHAFDGLDRGLVEVRMSALAEGGLRLTVADDGVGVAEAVDWPTQDTMGGRIVSGLVDALDGSLALSRGAAGTVVTIEVPTEGAAPE